MVMEKLNKIIKLSKKQVYSDESRERIVLLKLDLVGFLNLVKIDFLNDQQKQDLINLQTKLKEMERMLKTQGDEVIN